MLDFVKDLGSWLLECIGFALIISLPFLIGVGLCVVFPSLTPVFLVLLIFIMFL